MATTAPDLDPSSLRHIHGIEDYWERRTVRTQRRIGDEIGDEIGDKTENEMADRVLLDVLGLGIGQALPHLAQTRPSFEAFEEWVIATAGRPDPSRVARYNAWATGAPMPEAAAAELAAIDAMAPVLGAADLAHWDEHGYVVLRAAVTREEAAAAEALLWRVVEADPRDRASWYGGRAGIMVEFFQHPALEAARRSARIHKAFAQIHGTSDLWSTTDRMGFNPPEHDGYRFPGPHLHWDTSLTLPIPLATGGILYLTDTRANQGAFRVVPGFHRRIAGWLAALGEADPRRVDLGGEAVPIPGQAGDLVIWRQELPHGASPNTAERPRMVQYVNRYAPALVGERAWR